MWFIVSNSFYFNTAPRMCPPVQNSSASEALLLWSCWPHPLLTTRPKNNVAPLWFGGLPCPSPSNHLLTCPHPELFVDPEVKGANFYWELQQCARCFVYNAQNILNPIVWIWKQVHNVKLYSFSPFCRSDFFFKVLSLNVTISETFHHNPL